jgi:cytochrome P450
MDFLNSLTPDEGVLLLVAGFITLLASLGFAIWLMVS